MRMDSVVPSTLYSLDAEQSVLGSLLISPNAQREVIALTPDDFYRPDHRAIFDAMQALIARKQPIDLITVDEELHKRNQREGVGGVAYLIELSQHTPSAANIAAYVRMVSDSSTRRRFMGLCEQAIREAADPMSDPMQTMEQLRADLNHIGVASGELVSYDEVLMRTYNSLDRRVNGEIPVIASGLIDLDDTIGGFFPGELTIIGARPAVGKSALGQEIAVNAADKGRKVVFASLEMADEQFGQRLFSNASGVSGTKMRQGKLEEDDWRALAESMVNTAGRPLKFDFKGRSIEEISINTRRLADDGMCDMLVVDYLQLAEAKGKFEADRLRVEKISHTLKWIAKDCNIPVVALAQVNRQGGDTVKARCPALKELKDSGALEQDADGVIFIHRPDDYDDPTVYPAHRNPQVWNTIKESGYEYIVLSVAKQRQGQTGLVYVYFDPARMRFYNMEWVR